MLLTAGDWLEREPDRALEDSSPVIVNRGSDLTESGGSCTWRRSEVEIRVLACTPGTYAGRS